MIEALETLQVLAETGTMTATATRLRVTQSAISKRIDALESRLGRTLVEPAGRRVTLTAFGLRLVERTRPLLADLAAACDGAGDETRGRIVLGVSESILASWGAESLAAVRRELPAVEIVLNSHRTPVAVDHVRAGDYNLAICAGHPTRQGDLVCRRLLEEEMVIVPAGRARLRLPEGGGTVRVMAIEPASATWSALAPGLAALERTAGLVLEVTETVQSFPVLVQLARSGHGHGLVPRPLALALGVPASRLVPLPPPGLSRPVELVSRKRTLERPLVQEFTAVLIRHLPRTGQTSRPR